MKGATKTYASAFGNRDFVTFAMAAAVLGMSGARLTWKATLPVVPSDAVSRAIASMPVSGASFVRDQSSFQAGGRAPRSSAAAAAMSSRSVGLAFAVIGMFAIIANSGPTAYIGRPGKSGYEGGNTPLTAPPNRLNLLRVWSDHLTSHPRRSELAVIEPIRRSRLYQSIVEQIESLLEKGELRPGDQLPPERALAEQFQVSRASVREALRTLELLGVVETRAGGGTFVRQVAPDALARPLHSLIARGHSVPDVIEFRGLIEPALAALAATRISDAQLAELREILAAQERRVAADETYVEEDTRFHEVIGDAAKNELLTTMLAVVWDVLRASREQWLQTNQRAHASLDAHRRILDALSRRDAETARRASAEHIRAVGEGILKLLGGRNG